jgi:hypothetical protein
MRRPHLHIDQEGVTRPRARDGAQFCLATLAQWLLILAVFIAPVPASGQQLPTVNGDWRTLMRESATSRDEVATPVLKERKLLKANFEKTKSDAAELAALAKQLREKLDQPDADAHSAEIANLAERIGKLAKKIRGQSMGF